MFSLKEALFAAAFLTSAPALSAQSLSAGTVAIGGNVGYNHTSGKNSGLTSSGSGQNVSTSSEITSWQLYLLPSVSYFVADNLALGLTMTYSLGRRTEDAVYVPAFANLQHASYKSTSLRAGVFTQYYKMLTTQFGLTARLGAGYQRLQEDRNGSNTTGGMTYSFNGSNTSQGYYVDLTPGLIFFPIPKFSLTASMGSLGFGYFRLTDFQYDDTNNNIYAATAKSENNNFSANFGLDAFQLGGTYFFGR